MHTTGAGGLRACIWRVMDCIDDGATVVRDVQLFLSLRVGLFLRP